MNFSYGIIGVVGVLAAISLGFIFVAPNDIIEPQMAEEKTIACNTQWDPVCGVDGQTYGNMCALDAADVGLDYKGECLAVQSKPAIVSIPQGSAVPGCEETDECYLPFEITVDAGTTVVWSNDDTAAHTVTSGLLSEGGDGMFDSSLFAAGTTYEVTFSDAGTFDYFCLVHPWMTGIVNVN